MNNSKKTIKGPKKVSKKQFTINPKIWVVLATVLGLSLVVGILFDQFYKRPLVTVDGEKYYLEDLTYQIYNTESTYDYINQMYGGNYWDMPYNASSNMTVRDYAKVEMLNNMIYEQILYNEAVDQGYSLTQEELDKVDDDVSFVLEGLSDKVVTKNGFTDEYLTSIFSMNALANRYKQDVVDGFDIDDEAIKAEISYDEYRQYDIEYLYISTTKTDPDDYSQTPLDESEKKVALDKITALRDEALTSQNWSEIIPEDEKDVQYRESNFLPKDTFFSEDLMNTMLDMDKGAITDVIEEEAGYYVIRMIDNNSAETYDRMVEEAITKKENDYFGDEYNNNIAPNHTFEIHSNAVRNIRLGRITLVD